MSDSENLAQPNPNLLVSHLSSKGTVSAMQNDKPKRGRPKRRDYRKELEDLKRYCEISIEIMMRTDALMSKEPELRARATHESSYMDGQADALKAVLARLEQK